MLGAFWTSNMAEFTMFSMSGGGGFLWIFVFVGIAFDAARQRQDALQGRFADFALIGNPYNHRIP